MQTNKPTNQPKNKVAEEIIDKKTKNLAERETRKVTEILKN